MYYPNDIDLDVLNENFDKLHFVNGVAIYFDKNKTHRDTFDDRALCRSIDYNNNE